MASLSLRNATKKYPNDFVAIKDPNLTTEDKESIIFVGPPRYGKPTTLCMIVGLEDTSPNKLYIGDKLANDVKPKGRDITMVFQNHALYSHTSVYDNVASGLKPRKTPKAEIDEKVYNAARILDPEHLLGRKSRVLSGGQRRRVAMGRAIVRSPKVFLMDEPLPSLDAKLRDQTRVEIPKLYQGLETTVIYIIHDQTETMALGTRIVIMRDGVVRQIDSPQNLYDKLCNKFVVEFIGAPQINMVKAVVGKLGPGITLTFGEYTVALPEGKAKKLEGAGYAGKAVVLGIRSEDLHDEGSFLTMLPKNVFDATVRVYEMPDSEVLLYFDIEDTDFIAKVNPRTATRPGDIVQLTMDLEKIHVFDKDTELVIPNWFL